MKEKLTFMKHNIPRKKYLPILQIKQLVSLDSYQITKKHNKCGSRIKFTSIAVNVEAKARHPNTWKNE